MKKKYLLSCVVLLVLLAGCIKEEGELLTIVRTDVVDEKGNTNTVVTDGGGYMEAKARMDVVVDNSFETILNAESQIEDLNVYSVFSSSFSEINKDRNIIKEVGYVYALKENMQGVLKIGDKNCKRIAAEYQEQGDSVFFSQRVDKLEFNKTYCVRSYAICEVQGDADSVLYNNNVLEYSTVLPEDVWFQRKDAPSEPQLMAGRTNAFICSVDDKIYLYGGSNGGSTYYNDLWVYNSAIDMWEQKATFEAQHSHYIGKEKRANGATFVYDNPTNGNDKLIYFVGGEINGGEYTGTVIYYSTVYGRFCNRADHPNAGTQYKRWDEDGNPVYDRNPDTGEYTTDPPTQTLSSMGRAWVEDLPIYAESGDKNGNVVRTYHGLAGAVAFTLNTAAGKKYFVAFGKNDNSNNGQKHVQTSVYEYRVQYDKTDNGPWERCTMTWSDVLDANDKTAEGFYQPVCVDCGEQGVIIGSGESSKQGLSRTFYNVSYSVTSQKIRLEPLPLNEDFKNGFKERANAAAFYLDYTRSGVQYTRFYVGTGRLCSEEDWTKSRNNGAVEPEMLLNDFWCYDFNTRQWSRKADCSNIYRQGAVGFSVKRVDDYYVKQYGVNVRGMLSFGEGCTFTTANAVRNDNWEYIP